MPVNGDAEIQARSLDEHWQGLEAPRIAPARPGAVSIWVRPLLKLAGRVTGGPPPNIFATLAKNPKLFASWVVFGARLMPRGKLARVDTELVILRVAYNNRCRYEWDHHVRIGKRSGLTDAEIDRVAAGPAAAEWSEHRRALLAACDEMHAQRLISDATWSALAIELSEQQMIELTMLIGHYSMLAAAIATLGVQPEATDPAHRR